MEINWKETVLKEGSKLPTGEVATVLVMSACTQTNRVSPEHLEILVEGKRKYKQITNYALSQLKDWFLGEGYHNEYDMAWLVLLRGDLRNRRMFEQILELFQRPPNPTSDLVYDRMVRIAIMKSTKIEDDQISFDEEELRKFGVLDEPELVH